MPTNEIYAFGTGGTVADGDVMELAAYLAESDRLKGNQAGIAKRALVNTVLRQAAHMSAGLAQFIAERYEPGVVDDGDLDKVEAGLEAVIQEMIESALPSAARIETDYIDASAMIPSDGSSAEVLETPTYGRRYSYRVLGASADDSLCITYPMPEAWDRGPVKAKVVWMPADGETVGNQLVMTLTAQARGNENFLDVGRQAGVTITDVAPGDGRLLISDASAALTVGGTLSGNRMIIFELVRDVDGGTTPMTGEARIIGLMIQYTCNQPVTAW